MDKEVKSFEDQLFECDINFPPSYPFTEDSTSSSYMKTRCPAWCDRILMNNLAMELLKVSTVTISFTMFSLRHFYSVQSMILYEN